MNYIFITTAHPGESQGQSKFTTTANTCQTPRNFFFKMQEQFSLTVFTLLMQLKRKIKRQYYLNWVNDFAQ